MKMILAAAMMFTIAFLNFGTFNYGISETNADSTESNHGLKINKDTEVLIQFNEAKLAPENVRKVFNELFAQYVTIKDALVYRDSQGAVRNTLKLLDDMKEKSKDIDLLTKDARWALFTANFDNIKRKIESTTFISEQRFMFNEISRGMGEFIKTYGMWDKTIYLMQCDSGLTGGRAQWFSDSRDRKNPYFGTMDDTTCIKVKEIWEFR